MTRRLIFALCLAALPALAEEGRKPGPAVFGTREWVEYIPGTLPLVLCSPHGGRLLPEDLPDRTSGVVTADANTQELTRETAAEILRNGGGQPHVIICHLHRSKLDANRDKDEAAQGNAAAEKAWEEYHDFIQEACRAAIRQHGRAFLVDMHGQSHPEPRVEVGYLHTPEELAVSEDQLNDPAFARKGSLRLLAADARRPYAQLLHGPRSLGALLEEAGYAATPSPRQPVPDRPYYSGGYTVARHVREIENLAGVQIEANRVKIRDSAENRQRFAKALAGVLAVFLHEQLGLEGSSAGGS